MRVVTGPRFAGRRHDEPVIRQSETQIVVEQTVDAGAPELFAVLADPRRHIEIDGSGTLRPTSGTSVITGVGQVFTMAMTYPSLGEYRTDNLVVEFERDRRLTWATSRTGLPPAGVWWTWVLTPGPDGRTTVTHIYDWSRVVDPAVLARVSFPRVSADQLEATVEALARAAA